MKNHLTFDIEEAFQASNFEATVPRNRWATLPSRVVANTERILRILAAANLKATCFVVGWVAERHPELVRMIDRAGHEIAAHSYLHELVYDLSPAGFREDLQRNVAVLTSVTGKSVLGYRAPSYTITPRSLWALDVLAEAGFRYDSSVYPVRYHPRYGLAGAPLLPYVHPNGLREFPLPVARVLGQTIPIATGFYFRFLPYPITRLLMRRNNARAVPVTVNLHPWELDPDQPRLPSSAGTRFRHYHNLKRTARRLAALVRDFEFQPLRDALESLNSKTCCNQVEF